MIRAVFISIAVTLLLIHCSSAPRYHYRSSSSARQTDQKGHTSPPLLVKGVRHTATFTASYYGEKFHGRKTSTGETFDMYGLSAAHKSLPFGTILKVTYPVTGKSVLVKINDRGPFVEGRDIDLSYGAAAQLGLIKHGVGKVKVTVVKWGLGK